MVWSGTIVAAGAAVLLLAPAMASAQADSAQVVTTAAASAPAPREKANVTPDSITDFITGDDDDGQGPAVRPDHRIHGEVSVGVGTNGYREVYGQATVPIGDVGQATIGIGSSQIGRR
jgi:hypothetical protein